MTQSGHHAEHAVTCRPQPAKCIMYMYNASCTSRVKSAAMTWLQPVLLQGSRASLAPLSHGHTNDLVEALQDGELWKLWYTSIPAPDKLGEFIDQRLAAQAKGSLLPFAVIDNTTAKAVGMTNYLNVEPDHRRVEIGGTWYRKSVQRSQVNTQCKFLLLDHAFDALRCIAVEFRTHFFNYHSRSGIERLGAKLDGVLWQMERPRPPEIG